MSNRTKRVLTLLLAAVCLVYFALPVHAEEITTELAYARTKAQLGSSAAANTPIVGSVGGEWIVIGLARSGADTSDWKNAYYENVVEFVNANINASEQLHRNKSTENSRIILALTALGYDVTNVAGHNLLMGLTSMSYLQKQGINGPIWALIAFDSHAYDIPDGGYGTNQVTREKLIEYILSKQLSDGGWALSGTAGDPDMTGMAVQSLAPYYGKKSEVTAALARAITCMSNMVGADGSLTSWGTDNSESCAQVITALAALKIDLIKDSRFIRNGKTLLDNLMRFYVSDGGFAHVLQSTDGYVGGEYNQMATEQAFYSLAAYYRMASGQTALYDMTDVTIAPAEEKPVYGDVNGDSLINSADAAMIYACHNGKLTLTESQLRAADVNGDGIVNSADAAMVYAFHNGKLAVFPAG